MTPDRKNAPVDTMIMAGKEAPSGERYIPKATAIQTPTLEAEAEAIAALAERWQWLYVYGQPQQTE